MEFINDETLLWPEMQTNTSEEFKKKAHLWKREMILFKRKIADDPELVIPKGAEFILMISLRLCGYNHEAALRCLRRSLQPMKENIDPSQGRDPRKSVLNLKEEDEAFWPELLTTPANQTEKMLSNVKREFCLLKEKLAEEKGLVLPLDDDELLLRFFRARKYDHNRTLLLIRNYFRNRVDNLDLFQGYFPSAILHHFALNLITLNPYADGIGRFICTGKVGQWNPATSKLEDAYRYFLIHFESLSFVPLAQIHGIVLLLDMRGFRLTDVRYMTPSFLSRFFGAIQIHLHGSDMESLHQYISPELLHSDYGGSRGSFSCDGMPESILQFEHTFKHISEFGYKTKTGLKT